MNCANKLVLGKILGKKLERNIRLYFFHRDIFLSLQGLAVRNVIKE
jgi:hypothetical protein